MARHIDPQEVRHIAHLSRLKLSDEEIARFGAQLSDVLDYMQTLNELDTSDVEPTAHPLPIRNVLRDDVPGEPIGADNALANAPARADDYFKVPKVLDQDSA